MNKLREKFNPLLENRIYNHEKVVDQLEQITDDAMIKFFFFMNSKIAKNIIDEIYDENQGDEYHTNELLQIFKNKYYEFDNE